MTDKVARLQAGGAAVMNMDMTTWIILLSMFLRSSGLEMIGFTGFAILYFLLKNIVFNKSGIQVVFQSKLI